MKLNVFISSQKDGIMSKEKQFFPNLTKEERNILYESTLSYLGLGVQDPYAAWGTMISASKDPVVLSNYMNLWLPAGILIVIAVLGFNFIGDGLRDAMDPKAKK